MPSKLQRADVISLKQLQFVKFVAISNETRIFTCRDEMRNTESLFFYHLLESWLVLYVTFPT